jgi:hypothetical protein
MGQAKNGTASNRDNFGKRGLYSVFSGIGLNNSPTAETAPSVGGDQITSGVAPLLLRTNGAQLKRPMRATKIRDSVSCLQLLIAFGGWSV